MKQLLWFLWMALITASAVAQTAPVFCHFAAPGIMTCNSPQGLAPASPPISSSPGPAIRPIPPPRPYVPPLYKSPAVGMVQPIEPPERPVTRQLPPPNDTDLKSAYCVGVISRFNKEVAAIRQVHVTTTSDAERKELESSEATTNQMVQEENIKIARLQAYLSPRLHSVDTSMLLSAWKQGQTDYANIESETKVCTSNCSLSDPNSHTQCLMTCNEGTEAYHHTKICQRLAFLPY